ncbi:MAG: 30S ribosomal protein S2 [Candidatus Magasanikbacteria bacterium]|jgi:small subunit ribosomal protein S2|nr:30S ribosomal protein S2 [Candidatus Magasanikbacteria bacterium]MBT4547346.1 30S ribosomal protein S2 [Candidatus Magasanikbacteria bacterium]MBT6819052.1 30S ribosomal protein S2 [Candidatus Magasanikbacteria bacterium]
MKIPSILEMLQAGVHFGHQTTRRHPKMDEYIFTKRNGVHIIDLEKTKTMTEEFLVEVQKMAKDGKKILFVSTKPQAKEIVKEAAINCGMPYLVDRWVGGLITNFSEIKKLIARYNKLKEEQASGELEKYTKKEQIDIAKQLIKMDISLSGLAGLKELPDALFIPSLQREKTAVTEATKMKVPVIGISDTNANPDKADLFIPANDDAINSIKMMVSLVSDAIKIGVDQQEKTIGQNPSK